MWASSTSSSSSFSSTSLSSSTSSSSPSPYTASGLRLPKTREEVWNDISDLHHHFSSRGMIFQDFFSKDPPPTAVPSPPPTMLALNSAPLLFQQNHQTRPMLHVPAAAFDAGGRKNGSERRHKRMIKNRESAARSRARKQAYTNELELEVAHLLEENAKLRKQQEQFNREAAADNKKMKSLHRTSTAPF